MLDRLRILFLCAGISPGSPEAARLLDQPMRRRLLSLIESHPGIHASELCREAGEPWGTVQYHLSLLHKGDLVTAIDSGRERRFFPSETDPAKARLLALLTQGRRPEIAAYIRANPGARQVDVCDALGISRKTFRNSVLPMMKEGLVAEKRGLQSNRYFPLAGLEPLLAEFPGVAIPVAHPAGFDAAGSAPPPGPASIGDFPGLV
jgi:DNA-binding transcriptional ArsR family regulator